VDFQIPEDMQSEYGVLTPDVKRKILGLNAARLYGLDVPAELRIADDTEDTGKPVGASPVQVA
jgi:uncharacterized protein